MEVADKSVSLSADVTDCANSEDYWNEEVIIYPRECLTRLRGVEELIIPKGSFNYDLSPSFSQKLDLSEFA